MIDQIGTDQIHPRATTRRSLSKTIGLLTVVAMVGTIMAVWSAFLVWAIFKCVLWGLRALGV